MCVYLVIGIYVYGEGVTDFFRVVNNDTDFQKWPNPNSKIIPLCQSEFGGGVI